MGSRNNNIKWLRKRTNEPKSSDELNYEQLREFAQQGNNRFCFDCHQRGPTYVNMTIGSFVCMRCSGLLRGLTPPHRLKSMSMATFSTEEMDFLKDRGNEHCQKIWLSLYEGKVLTESSEEQEIKDFMIQKYERQRYCADPKLTGITIRPISPIVERPMDSNEDLIPTEKEFLTIWRSYPHPGPSDAEFQRKLREHRNMTRQMDAKARYDKKVAEAKEARETPLRPPQPPKLAKPTAVAPVITAPPPAPASNVNSNDFIADFSKADIFVADPPQRTTNGRNNNINTFISQPSFANFDNNPIFNSTNNAKPTVQSKLTSQLTSPPPEDRYAALKDLDNALKQHQEAPAPPAHHHHPHQDWATMTNSPQTNSMFSTTLSPQGSVSSFGSPLLENAFGKEPIWNPFSGSQFGQSPWGTPATADAAAVQNAAASMFNANPFRAFNGFNANQIQNGGFITQNGGVFRPPQATAFANTTVTSQAMQTNGFGDVINPFKLTASPGTNTTYSNNPFL